MSYRSSRRKRWPKDWQHKQACGFMYSILYYMIWSCFLLLKTPEISILIVHCPYFSITWQYFRHMMFFMSDLKASSSTPSSSLSKLPPALDVFHWTVSFNLHRTQPYLRTLRLSQRHLWAWSYRSETSCYETPVMHFTSFFLIFLYRSTVHKCCYVQRHPKALSSE